MLSKLEKQILIDLWHKLVPVAEDIGGEALYRMFTTFPKTKTYFSHLDLSHGSAHLRSLGKKIVLAIAEGTTHISTPLFTSSLGYLSRFHAYQLRIHPTNFKLFNHCMLVTLACHLGDNFSAIDHAATDKYLSAYAAVLAEKFRMFLVFPQTKTYFSHWPDLSPASDSVKNHGKKVMVGLEEAVNNIDDLFSVLSNLNEILSHSTLVVISNRFPNDFTAEAHLTLEKSFARVALALSDKYR